MGNDEQSAKLEVISRQVDSIYANSERVRVNYGGWILSNQLIIGNLVHAVAAMTTDYKGFMRSFESHVNATLDHEFILEGETTIENSAELRREAKHRVALFFKGFQK